MKRHQPRLPRPPLLPSPFPIPTSATPTSATFLSSLSSFSLRCRLPFLLLSSSLLLLSLLLLLLLLPLSSCLCRCRVVVAALSYRAPSSRRCYIAYTQRWAPSKWLRLIERTLHARAHRHKHTHTQEARRTQIAIQLIYDIRVTRQMQLEHVPDEFFN